MAAISCFLVSCSSKCKGCPVVRPTPAGKLFLSASVDQLALLCHVPKALAEAKGVTKQAWLDAVLKVLPGAKV